MGIIKNQKRLAPIFNKIALGGIVQNNKVVYKRGTIKLVMTAEDMTYIINALTGPSSNPNIIDSGNPLYDLYRSALGCFRETGVYDHDFGVNGLVNKWAIFSPDGSTYAPTNFGTVDSVTITGAGLRVNPTYASPNDYEAYEFFIYSLRDVFYDLKGVRVSAGNTVITLPYPNGVPCYSGLNQGRHFISNISARSAFDRTLYLPGQPNPSTSLPTNNYTYSVYVQNKFNDIVFDRLKDVLTDSKNNGTSVTVELVREEELNKGYAVIQEASGEAIGVAADTYTTVFYGISAPTTSAINSSRDSREDNVVPPITGERFLAAYQKMPVGSLDGCVVENVSLLGFGSNISISTGATAGTLVRTKAIDTTIDNLKVYLHGDQTGLSKKVKVTYTEEQIGAPLGSNFNFVLDESTSTVTRTYDSVSNVTTIEFTNTHWHTENIGVGTTFYGLAAKGTVLFELI